MAACRYFVVKVVPNITARSVQADAEVELAELTKLRHPNVASLLGYALTDGGVELYEEWAGDESLVSFLSTFAPVQIGVVRRIARGVLEGLAYLHSSDPVLVHGKVQTSSVILDEHLNPKLVDLPRSALASLGPAAAPPRHSFDAPRTSTDIWCFGKMLLEIARHDFADAILPGVGSPVPAPSEVPAQALLQLVQRCLKHAPWRRPSAWQVLVMEPFFDDAGDGEEP